MSGPTYSTDGLLAGIEAAKNNIKTFEEAIAKEYATISEYRVMIEALERKKHEAEIAQKNVHIEVVEDVDDE